jgi:hypothetical protein
VIARTNVSVPVIGACFVLIVLAIAVGALGTLLQISHGEAAVAKTEAKKLKEDLRVTTGKLYDLQEGKEDEIDRVKGQASMDLWEKQQQLDSCQKSLQNAQPAASQPKR